MIDERKTAEAEYILGAEDNYLNQIKKEMRNYFKGTSNWPSAHGMDVTRNVHMIQVALRKHGYNDGAEFAEKVYSKLSVHTDPEFHKYTAKDVDEEELRRTVELITGNKPEWHRMYTYPAQFSLMACANYCHDSMGRYLYPFTTPLIDSMKRKWYFFRKDIVLGVVIHDGWVYGGAAGESKRDVGYYFALPLDRAQTALTETRGE